MNKLTLLSALIVVLCISGTQQKCTVCGAYTTQTQCNAVPTLCTWSGSSCQAIASSTACSSQTSIQCAISSSLGQCAYSATSSCSDISNPNDSCTSQTTNCPAYSTNTQYCMTSATGCAFNTLFTCSSGSLMSFFMVGFTLLMMIMI